MRGHDASTGVIAPEPELVTLAPATTAVIRRVVSMAGLRDFFDAAFQALPLTIAAQRIDVRSPAFGLYHGTPGETLDLEVGFVIERPILPEGDVITGSLPGGRAGRMSHLGSFDGLGSSWQRLHSWLQGQGLSPGPQRWEYYVTRPTPDMDPADLRTDLIWPIADA